MGMHWTTYRNYKIRIERAPTPAGFLWEFSHEDYDGPGDNRLGFAHTLEDAKATIDERVRALALARAQCTVDKSGFLFVA